MKMLIILFCSLLVLFLLDQFGLWLERKGWLYYRKQKPNGGIIGNSLQELNAILMPSSRHVIEAKQNEIVHQKSKKDEKNT